MHSGIGELPYEPLVCVNAIKKKNGETDFCVCKKRLQNLSAVLCYREKPGPKVDKLKGSIYSSWTCFKLFQHCYFPYKAV